MVVQPPKQPNLGPTTLANQLVKPPQKTTAGASNIVPQMGISQAPPQPSPVVSQPPMAPSLDPVVDPARAPQSPPPNSAGPSYGPGNNLIGTQINPSAPTAGPQNTNYGTGAIQQGQDPQNNAQFQQYTTGFNNALSNISNGPNRTQMAMTALQDFDTAGQPQLEAGYRRVGQRAASLGRLGAGMTTNDLTGLSATYQRDRGLAARGLARDVAEGDINDRYRTADLYSNARGQQYGFGQDQRDYSTGVDRFNSGALFDRQRAGNTDEADWQDRLYSQGRAGRNDLRGERDFQTGRSDKAQSDRIDQRVLEEQLLNQAFGRGERQLNQGRQGNPADYYMTAGGVEQDQANQMFGGAGELMKNRSPVLTDEMIRRIMQSQQ